MSYHFLPYSAIGVNQKISPGHIKLIGFLYLPIFTGLKSTGSLCALFLFPTPQIVYLSGPLWNRPLRDKFHIASYLDHIPYGLFNLLF